jgi:DMSO/TMAO reductase YedYZ heme-binding membrane subunit
MKEKSMSQLKELAMSLLGASEHPLRVAVAVLDFYSGVSTLVALSSTVMIGVAATDRMLLRPRHRLQAQLLHRAMGLTAMGFLILHVTIRVMEKHVQPIDAAVPFLAQGRTLFLGLGTVAAYLMVLLAVTGVVRGRFARGSRPAVWRSIHAFAYVAWPAALLHGLNAGRTPKTWVVLSYVVCVLLVVVGLLIRLHTPRRRGLKRPPRGTAREVKIEWIERPRRPAAAPRRYQPARPDPRGRRNAALEREAGRRPNPDGYWRVVPPDRQDSGNRRRR